MFWNKNKIYNYGLKNLIKNKSQMSNKIPLFHSHAKWKKKKLHEWHELVSKYCHIPLLTNTNLNSKSHLNSLTPQLKFPERKIKCLKFVCNYLSIWQQICLCIHVVNFRKSMCNGWLHYIAIEVGIIWWTLKRFTILIACRVNISRYYRFYIDQINSLWILESNEVFSCFVVI